jgi:copper(I)-binding protein
VKQLVAIVALVLAACGQEALRIDGAEYRAPLGASGIGVAYFSVTSRSDDAIVGISSPEADRIEMHTSVTEGTQSSMKRQDRVELPAGKTITFAPKGLHLMVFAPKPLQPGATFPIQIDLQSGRSETVLFHPALIGQYGVK